MSKLSLQEISKYSKMINRKQKEKENRKNLLKISMMKLHLIEDPESRLRRSVLINNTFRTLQLEHRESVRQEQLESLRRKRSSDCLHSSNVDQSQPKMMHFNDSASRTENVSAEDILSDVILPPPLNPNLNHVVVENYKVIDCYTGSSAEGSGLTPPWMEKEYFDWAQISEEEQKIWQDDDDEEDTDGDLSVTVQNSVNGDTMNEDEGYDEFSDSSSDDDDSNQYEVDIVEENIQHNSELIICRLDTQISEPCATSLVSNLLTPLES